MLVRLVQAVPIEVMAAGIDFILFFHSSRVFKNYLVLKCRNTHLLQGISSPSKALRPLTELNVNNCFVNGTHQSLVSESLESKEVLWPPVCA